MSVAEATRKAGRPYDRAARNKAQKKPRYTGVYVYIPEDVIRDAGFDPEQPIYYRLRGYQRSRNAGSVMIDLYREP